MKNKISSFSLLLIAIVLVLFRTQHLHDHTNKTLNVTTWDAFGYYAYLPATFIYHDTKELKWVNDIDAKYNVTGGQLYQATHLKSGNYVFKYLGGVAIMQAPFFLAGHLIAKISGAPADGFSWPYQYCLAFGAILWAMFGLFLLRKILLKYFPDGISALTLILVTCATNFVQYAAIDNAMSHVWIFPLYSIILYATIKWHESPSVKWTIIIGAVIGLATISRPTELVMLFIPLFWNTHTKEFAKEKWALVRKFRKHIIWISVAGFFGILPQLLYWKYSTGSFVYDVGSKWMFLNPWFRVLFGWQKGWFIYTPVAILMTLGLFFVKKFPFRKSVIIFCLLNFWIIMAWSDWKYGASYSCRALVQSYPVLALSLAAFLMSVKKKWQQYLQLGVGAYLILLNMIQLYQYGNGVLLYDGMTKEYYGKIYMQLHPFPLTLLMGADHPYPEADDLKMNSEQNVSSGIVSCDSLRPFHLGSFQLSSSDQWFEFNGDIRTTSGMQTADIRTTFFHQKQDVSSEIFHVMYPTASFTEWNAYQFYAKKPDSISTDSVSFDIVSFAHFNGEIRNGKLNSYSVTK